MTVAAAAVNAVRFQRRISETRTSAPNVLEFGSLRGRSALRKQRFREVGAESGFPRSP